MEIEKRWLEGKDYFARKAKADLMCMDRSNTPIDSLHVGVLFGEKELDWEGIKAAFVEKPEVFDSLLFRLHFRRKHKIDHQQRERVLMLLAIGYLFTKDIRYFNEFLWFRREHESFEYMTAACIASFFDNLDSGNRHVFKEMDRALARSLAERVDVTIDRLDKRQGLQGTKIGLLGSPTFFPRVRRKLLKKGYSVCCFFFPYHPSRWINYILRHQYSFWLLKLFKGAWFPFHRIDLHYKNPEIGSILEEFQLDVGFHKLGFIIKNNMISAFRLGLINDHWGYLPFVRGRSTIEYSLLLGVPVVCTTHFVVEAVDAGDIINYYDYTENVKRCRSVRKIRRKIRQDRDFRAIDSIEIAVQHKGPVVENDAKMGLTFYSMHPALIRFIDRAILQRQGCD